MPCCKKHKALISKYKAHILKYMPCIFRLFKHLNATTYKNNFFDLKNRVRRHTEKPVFAKISASSGHVF